MAVLIALLRYWKPRASEWNGPEVNHSGLEIDVRAHTTTQIAKAWMPYALLVFCVLLWGYKPLQATLDSVTLAIRWPFLNDVVVRMPPIVTRAAPYHAIFNLNWISAAGTACMASTLLSAVFLRMSLRRFSILLISVGRTILLRRNCNAWAGLCSNRRTVSLL
jgi:lactate permease